MSHTYPFHGHDDGLVIDGPDTGFASRPMTPAELAARKPALQIAKDIFRHAFYAGVCYHEIWGLIAKTIQGALMNCPECSKPMIQKPCQTPINYAAEIQWQKWRCEACKLIAKVETIFSHDDSSVDAVGANDV